VTQTKPDIAKRAPPYPDIAARPSTLAKLLRRRAVAAEAGLDDLEATLRGQISEILPTRIGSADGDRPAIRELDVSTGDAGADRPQSRRTETIKRGWLKALPTVTGAADPAPPAGSDPRALKLFSS
jgi:hypothetical protein